MSFAGGSVLALPDDSCLADKLSIVRRPGCLCRQGRVVWIFLRKGNQAW